MLFHPPEMLHNPPNVVKLAMVRMFTTLLDHPCPVRLVGGGMFDV